MASFDQARWFRLLATGTLEEITAMVKKFARQDIVNLADTSSFKHISVFYAVNRTDEALGSAMLKFLLSKKAKINYKDGINQTVLFYACRHGHANQIATLVKAGADPNHEDVYGQTPLFYASREGKIDTVKSLISQYRVDINKVDKAGQSALFYACREGNYSTAKFLVKEGIDVNQRDRQGQSALTWAKRSKIPEIIELLQSKGAVDTYSRNVNKSSKKYKCQLMWVNKRGEKTALDEEDMKSFEENYPQIAKYLHSPETLDEIDKMSMDKLERIKPWQKPAKELMKILWRTKNAWLFHEPVDPVRLKIADYFDVIKHPMDFGTIKKKLYNNAYATCREFLADIDLTFANCNKYNQPGSEVRQMVKNVFKEYKNQVRELGLEKKFKGYSLPKNLLKSFS